jgi:hypothetical protein
MANAEKILKNLTLDYSFLSIPSIKKGIEKLRGKEDFLEAIHIYIEHLSPELYPPKKKYFDISKIDKPTKLDEWAYQHLVDNREYGDYLDKYLPLKDKLKYSDVDEYIMNKHYRPKAIKILSQSRKSFDLQKWKKKRFGYNYRRKTNLILKEGIVFPLDFRNRLESLFILKSGEDKQILARGGGGGSSQRMKYTMFTAIFYLLGKKKRIKHYLLKYNSFNEYEYLSTYYKPIVTWNLGSNYSLDKRLKEEIRKNGVKLDKIKKLKSVANIFFASSVEKRKKH